METTGKHNGKKVMAIIGISLVVVIRLIIMVVTGGIILTIFHRVHPVNRMIRVIILLWYI